LALANATSRCRWEVLALMLRGAKVTTSLMLRKLGSYISALAKSGSYAGLPSGVPNSNDARPTRLRISVKRWRK
jgi:hypothetical protein